MSSSATANKPQVTVTGGNGYIASVLIDELVKRGYRINATVRSIAKEAAFQERFPTVKLFEADLLTPGAFDASFAGSEIVFHTASPVVMQSADPENEIIKPAVQGVENALRSAFATPTVRRIVLTSSKVATHTSGQTEPLTEESWNSDPAETAFPYSRSKTLAEQRAWSLIKEYQASDAFKSHPISLVTVLPSLTVGVSVFPEKARSSVGLVATIFDGTAKAQGGLMNITATYVDVRDVAKAHIDAAEKTSITGRLQATHRKPLSFQEIAQLLIKKFPQLAPNIPTEYASAKPMFPLAPVNNVLTEKTLGWEFRDPVPALVELVESLIASGAVKIGA